MKEVGINVVGLTYYVRVEVDPLPEGFVVYDEDEDEDGDNGGN